MVGRLLPFRNSVSLNGTTDGVGMGLRALLRAQVGVWQGTYVHLSPAGDVVDRFPSRQELRLDGDRWYERVVYRKPGGDEVHDFRGRFDGDRLVIDDPDFHGEATLIADDLFLFPYRWKSRPDQRFLETVSFPAQGRKVRLWQRFDGGELAAVTVIEEAFDPGAQPERWQ